MKINNIGHRQSPSARSGGKEFGMRLGILSLGYVLFFVAIVLRLLNIQVIDVQKYKSKASRQYQRDVVEQAKRGVVMDRNGHLLAQSVQTISYYADPWLVANTEVKVGRKKVAVDKTPDVARLFAQRFGKSRDHYMRLLRNGQKQKRRFIWLERSVPVEHARELMETAMTGVDFKKEQYRYYLNLAPQVVGLVNTDNKGISGLEIKYDQELRGRDGMKIFQRSATGTRFLAADADQVSAKEGLSLQLTLDADIQSIVESEIANTANKFNASAAVGIVMDVKTGAILAMANYPTFDMNNRKGFRESDARNRAIIDAFDPGSTFKIVMASAAREVLHRAAEDSVDAHNGAFHIYNRTIRDHEKFERCTFRDAMVHSSNIVAAKTAMELGEKTFYDYVRRFGFGEQTGIGLVGESEGIVRPLKQWNKTTLPWMGYGYSVTTTPLQILQAYAAIANDGVLMKPYIVERLVDADGNAVSEFKPEKVRNVVSAETARYIRKEYLQPIVEEGSGVAAAVNGVAVGGKTGTAQKLSNGNYNRGPRSYIASFVGFFPVDEPRIAAIIVVDEPQSAYYASTVAAPLFSRICTRMIACSEDLKADLGMTAPEAAVLAASKSVAVPLLTGLKARDAEKLLIWNGLDISMNGDREGVVVEQDIAAGSMVEPGSRVRVGLSAQENQDPGSKSSVM